MDNAAPLVTIGMPVYNEARFISDSLESLLAQTYRNFRLVICDNASDDETPTIIEKYAAADDRITLERRPDNIGVIDNFNSVAQGDKGKYFMWAAGHDLWSPNYVEELVGLLEEDRRSVLAFGAVSWLDEEGNGIEGRPTRSLDTGGIANPVTRYNLTFWTDQNPIYGLMRSSALDQTALAPKCLAPGVVFLSQLAILGRFRYSADATFFRRQNRPREERSQRYERRSTTLYREPRRQRLGYWRLPIEFLRVATRTPLTGKARRQRRVLLVLSSFNAFIRYWGELRADLAELPKRDKGTEE